MVYEIFLTSIDISTLLSFWYVLPIAIIIASIAMIFGIGGAILFSPFFLIVLNLPPDMAIALGLLIEVFGFSSGLIAYARNKLINYHLGTRILPLTILAALLGASLGKYIPSIILEITLAGVLFLLAIAFLQKEKTIIYTTLPLHPEENYEQVKKKWFDFWQDFKKSPTLFFASAIGGLLVGLVSTGLGEINEYNFVKRLKMKNNLAAGTSVFIIAITALTASIFNLSYFSAVNTKNLTTIVQIAIFAIPGVIIGAQLGVHFSKTIDQKKALKTLPFLFIILGMITITKSML